MKRFIPNFSLKLKLNAPNILFILILSIIFTLYIQCKIQIDESSDEQKIIQQLSSELNSFYSLVEKTITEEHTFKALETKYHELKDLNNKNGSILTELNHIWEDIFTYNQISLKNETIELSIHELTGKSLTLSNDYIKLVTDKLRSNETRDNITPLETLVINGANTNTCANYEIRNRLLKTKDNLNNKTSLLRFVNKLVNNVDKDIELLSSTPLQNMAIEAKENNLKIQILVSDFILNLEEQNALKINIVERTNKQRQLLNEKYIDINNNISKNIMSGLGDIIVVLSILCIISIIFGMKLSKSIIKSLTDVIEKLQKTSEKISEVSNVTLNSTQKLAEKSFVQSASLQETSANLQYLNSVSRRNANDTERANNIIQETSKLIKESDIAMNELYRAFVNISDAGSEIKIIANTIDDITSDVNDLISNIPIKYDNEEELEIKLNVVMDIVDKLAEKTSQLSKQTSDVLKNIVDKIKEGYDIVAENNKAFNKLVINSQKINKIINKINSYSINQVDGLNQINNAVIQIDKATQENTMNAEESATTSEELKTQSQEMKSLVNKLSKIKGNK